MFSEKEFLKIFPCDWSALEETGRIDREAFAEDGLTPANLSLLARVGSVFVVREGGALTAEAIVLPMFPSRSAFLFSLAVAAKRRNSGHGKYLMECIFSELVQTGFEALELTVAPENSAALHLYLDRLGFKKIDFIENHFGHGKHRFLLRKSLQST